MKRLMTAALAATLMCGASAYAYAQDSTQPAPASSAPASGASGSDQSTQGGMNPAPPSDPGMSSAPAGAASGGAMQPPASGGQDAGAPPPAPDAGAQPAPPAGGQDMSAPPAPPAGGQDTSAPPAPPAGGQDMSSAPQAAGNTPDGQPPSNYPPCTHKGQDRCVQSGHMESTGMATHHKAGKHHRKMHKHHKKAMASKASGGSGPASASRPRTRPGSPPTAMPACSSSILPIRPSGRFAWCPAANERVCRPSSA